jgi:hypothetical protein
MLSSQDISTLKNNSTVRNVGQRKLSVFTVADEFECLYISGVRRKT